MKKYQPISLKKTPLQKHDTDHIIHRENESLSNFMLIFPSSIAKFSSKYDKTLSYMIYNMPNNKRLKSEIEGR